MLMLVPVTDVGFFSIALGYSFESNDTVADEAEQHFILYAFFNSILCH